MINSYTEMYVYVFLLCVSGEIYQTSGAYPLRQFTQT